MGAEESAGKQAAPPDMTLLTTPVEGGSGGGRYFFPLRPVLVLTGALVLATVSSMQPKLRLWFGSHPMSLSCECVNWCNGLFYRLECNTSVTESKNSFFKNLLILTLRLLEVDSVLRDLAALLPHSSLSQDICLGLVVLRGFPSFELQFFQMLVVLQISNRVYSFPL